MFLFAVVRDVQRNWLGMLVLGLWAAGFYSLSCETYSGTRQPGPLRSRRCRFLFPVVRDVQRNLLHRLVATIPRRVSIRCRARRTAELDLLHQAKGAREQSFYSLSCETYSGTLGGSHATHRCRRFLFAVVRDVQRNDKLYPYGVRIESFYSLSCETYSGTCPACGATVRSITRFLFAVVRDVQRNCSF